MDLLFMERI